MARGTITERRGIILRLEAEGRHAYAELLPLEHFGTESLEQATEFVSGLREVSAASLQDIPENLPATRFALESALLELESEDWCAEYHRDRMPLSKLLPANEKILHVLDEGIRDGFSIFKMKIGIGDFGEELQRVQSVIGRFTGEHRLRIDANEGLSVAEAERWLDHLEGLPVEFLEQPLKRDMVEETIAVSERYSTEIALDEAIASTEDMIRCWDAGFRGVYASKPLRLGELEKFLEWRSRSKAKISYSTVFETAIGSVFGVKLAASDPVNNFGLGYGVSHWLEEQELVLQSAPEFEMADILSLNRDAIWERLA